jgi:hypothetical protein
MVFKNVPVRLLGTRFTNANSCFKPGPHELQVHFLNTMYKKKSSQTMTVQLFMGYFFKCYVVFFAMVFYSCNTFRRCEQTQYDSIFYPV